MKIDLQYTLLHMLQADREFEAFCRHIRFMGHGSNPSVFPPQVRMFALNWPSSEPAPDARGFGGHLSGRRAPMIPIQRKTLRSCIIHRSD